MKLFFMDKNNNQFAETLTSYKKGKVGKYRIMKERTFDKTNSKWFKLHDISENIKFVSLQLKIVFQPKIEYLMKQMRNDVFKPPTGHPDFKIFCYNEELESKIRQPALAEKFKLEKIAEAQKLKAVLEAEAEAAAIQMNGEAKAFAIEAKAKAEAEQMSKKADAWNEYEQAALMEMMLKVKIYLVIFQR